MIEKEYYWRNREMREHVAVVDGIEQPTLILKNGTYINMFTKQWVKAHIWIFKDRIVYVGELLPDDTQSTEIIDCEGQFLVPGYIEPHAHPFQLYNPAELAMHAAYTGTTTLVNDNLLWYYLFSDKKKAFSLLDEMNTLPVSMYWWARYDAQTALKDEESYFNTENVLSWLSHPSVVQGGELTAWPDLLAGDDRLLHWIQETKQLGKPIEGHLPGASEATLTKMKLLGLSAEHESMTGADVMKRLELGYQVGLRYSSIRPDLPNMISELLEYDLQTFDQLTMTTDGSPPSFYEHGLMNTCIDIALEQGVPLVEAFRMSSYNAAKHLRLDDWIGSIAPGKIAHINMLQAKDNPHPIGVLAKGQWIMKDGKKQSIETSMHWEEFGVRALSLDWDLRLDDLQFSMPVGVEMINDVILKPYMVKVDSSFEHLPEGQNEAFLLMVDRNGKWRVNTMIKGFTNKLGALASSYSITGDVMLIGKDKKDMLLAFNRMKELGGGIVLVNEGKLIYELPLSLAGMMYKGNMQTLIEKEHSLKDILKTFGYSFKDPIYNLLFIAATHLPYIRVTQQGVMDVKNRNVLFPPTMR